MRAFPLLALLALACQTRGVEFSVTADAGGADRRRPGEEPDAPPGIDRPGDGPRPQADARDGCAPRPELCNGLDDDCDGLVDETFDLNTDPMHCGRCGNACQLPHAVTTCSVGRCRLAACEPGFVDLDRLEPDGCECEVTNEGRETCDGRDNDCDGQRDEGFDLQSDAENCGACLRKCEFPRAAALCQRGECRMGACEAGYLDLDANPRNGCEYACAPSNGGAEVCDGKDNDCDGNVDESDPMVGARCFPDGMQGCDLAAGRCNAPCAFGVWACLPGGLVCQRPTLPRPESCNGADDDCDGQADEDYDLQSDPRWCGACGRRCALPNAVPGCAAGACVIRSCLAGFVDLDRVTENGCEYACAADGPEVCDGKDNDCDGQTDTADADLLYPMVNFCRQTGECAGGPGGSPRWPERTFPVCTRPPGAPRPDWICNYPATVQLYAPNQIQGEESFCDGLDNDCDGMTDEHAKVGEPCTDNGTGECKRVGKYRCQADRSLSPICDVVGVPAPLPNDELCDGKDNDCDGAVDESWDNPPGVGAACAGGPCRGVRDDVVALNVAGKQFWIYRYEATRVDATADDQGTKETRACSRRPSDAGLRPWTLVGVAQARQACAAAGMRLCRTVRQTACSSAAIVEDEWGLACSAGVTCGAEARPFPYGCAYEAMSCQGADRGAEAVNAGALAACVTPEGVHDMSGNLAEWTDDCRGTLADGTGRRVYTLRGGSFNNVERGLRCDFMALAVAENFTFNDTGFRCCSSCPPGQADCGGQCVSLASDPGHCGACGRACPGGVCTNGFCR